MVVKWLFLWINKGWELTGCHLADFISLLFHFLNVSLINQVDFPNFSSFKSHGAKTPFLCEVSGKEFLKPRRQLTPAWQASTPCRAKLRSQFTNWPALRVLLYLPTVRTSISSSLELRQQNSGLGVLVTMGLLSSWSSNVLRECLLLLL